LRRLRLIALRLFRSLGVFAAAFVLSLVVVLGFAVLANIQMRNHVADLATVTIANVARDVPKFYAACLASTGGAGCFVHPQNDLAKPVLRHLARADCALERLINIAWPAGDIAGQAHPDLTSLLRFQDELLKHQSCVGDPFKLISKPCYDLAILSVVDTPGAKALDNMPPRPANVFSRLLELDAQVLEVQSAVDQTRGLAWLLRLREHGAFKAVDAITLARVDPASCP